MCYVGTVKPKRGFAAEDANSLYMAQDWIFLRVYMNRRGLYWMREIPIGISFSREGILVPGKEIVEPLFCSIYTDSRQGLLYSCFYTTILSSDSVAFVLDIVVIYASRLKLYKFSLQFYELNNINIIDYLQGYIVSILMATLHTTLSFLTKQIQITKHPGKIKILSYNQLF